VTIAAFPMSDSMNEYFIWSKNNKKLIWPKETVEVSDTNSERIWANAIYAYWSTIDMKNSLCWFAPTIILFVDSVSKN